MTSKKTTDPHIQQGWINLRAAITDTLTPWVPEHKVADLTDEIVTNHVAGPGWRPPLEPAPSFLRDARVKAAREAGSA